MLSILRTHKDELSQRFGVIDIAVFGSYTRNEQKQNSDIDVFVTLNKGFKTFDNFIELKFFVEGLTSKKIDLVIKDSIRKEFKDSILKEAEYA
ncbi:MAG: nucleotidyltransferase family protein [Ignavibacteria bacterium]